MTGVRRIRQTLSLPINGRKDSRIDIHFRAGGESMNVVPTNGLISQSTTRKRSSASLEGLKTSLASVLAAGCSKTLLAPFDTIKTMQQYHRSLQGTSLGFWSAVQMIVSRPKGIGELYVRPCSDTTERSLLFGIDFVPV
jgi:hypothetical protein